MASNAEDRKGQMTVRDNRRSDFLSKPTNRSVGYDEGMTTGLYEYIRVSFVTHVIREREREHSAVMMDGMNGERGNGETERKNEGERERQRDGKESRLSLFYNSGFLFWKTDSIQLDLDFFHSLWRFRFSRIQSSPQLKKAIALLIVHLVHD